MMYFNPSVSTRSRSIIAVAEHDSSQHIGNEYRHTILQLDHGAQECDDHLSLALLTLHSTSPLFHNLLPSSPRCQPPSRTLPRVASLYATSRVRPIKCHPQSSHPWRPTSPPQHLRSKARRPRSLHRLLLLQSRQTTPETPSDIAIRSPSRPQCLESTSGFSAPRKPAIRYRRSLSKTSKNETPSKTLARLPYN